MVALKLQNFGGMIPAVDAQLLPQNQAGHAENTWLYSGAIEAFRLPKTIFTPVSPLARRAYRIPKAYFDKAHIKDSYWMEFNNPDVDVIHSPTVGDSFERFYWAGAQSFSAQASQYNTKDRIIAGTSPLLLGIPQPLIAPTVTDTGAHLGLQESRAYVYTWVSAYGEEGAPSPATLLNGWSGDAWTIGLTPPGNAITLNRNLSKLRLYRTVTATAGPTTFFLVAEMDIATTSYSDTIASTVVTANNILESLYWTPPPADLEGMILMPNGIIASWRKNEIWFCEPYRPHAWPVSYTVAVEYPIIGLGVIGQSLVVCTTGNPYAVSGINPASMAISRIASFEPCLSRGSIVSSSAGVAYASPNGIVLAGPGGVQVATTSLISRDEWMNFTAYMNVPTLRAVALNGAYYCWGSIAPGCFADVSFDQSAFLHYDYSGAYRGAMIDLTNPRVGYVMLSSAVPIAGVFSDHWTGEAFLAAWTLSGVVSAASNINWVDITETNIHGSYIWRSKVLETPNQRSFEAMRVYFALTADSPAVLTGTLASGFWDDRLIWNEVGLYSNDVWCDSSISTPLRSDQLGIVRVFADGKLVFSRQLLNPGELFRLPSGFKATFWEIEIEGRVDIKSIEIATSAKELSSV